MSKRSKFSNYLEYYSLKAVVCFFWLFPFSFAQKIGQAIAVFIYYFVPVRKKHVINSLSFAFPEKDKKEIKNIAKNVYKNFMKTVMEMIFFPRMSDDSIRDMMRYDDNGALINDVIARGKGMIFMSAHYGNWELTALSFSKKHPISVIVARQSNPLVDKLINDIRTGKQGYRAIDKDDKMLFRGIFKTLRANETVAILADQDAGKQGVFVPFFGKEASTPKGPALFALKTGAPIVVAFAARCPDQKVNLKTWEIPFPNTGNEEEDIKIINTQYSRLLEEAVREYPDHWFWFHRKWKTRPGDSRR